VTIRNSCTILLNTPNAMTHALKSIIKAIPGVKALHVRWLGRGVKARIKLRMEGRRRALAAISPNACCAEIGVHEGDFSARILQAGTVRVLNLIDPWKFFSGEDYDQSLYGGSEVGGQNGMDARCERVRKRFSSEVNSGQVVFHRMLSSEAAEHFADGSLDWVYVDGDHQYEGVMADLVDYYRKLKSGGVMAGDDYGLPGWWKNGVQVAVDEFARTHPDATLEIIGDQFILRKP